MPSFDVVSEVDMHEVSNAVDQANREIGTRFDFKGTGSKFEQQDAEILMRTESEFQLKQMLDVLQNKLSKRGVDTRALALDDAETVGQEARQKVTVRQGLDSDLSKKIVKMTKEAKLKVQSAIQGDKVRVTGKKRDDLQQVISLLRDANIELPLQFINFRD